MAKCCVDNCEKDAYAKGMCRPHYHRMSKYGRTHKVVARGDHLVCTVEGCGVTTIKGHGLCLVHYRERIYKFRAYGISYKDYEKLLKEQNGCCAICYKEETSLFWKTPGKIKRLAIDHNHKTGKVRGLLCWKCNSVLGRLEENPEWFQAMIDYLNKHKER